MWYRAATLDDAAAIAALHAESWRTTYRGALRDAYLDGDVLAERRTIWQERLGAPAASQYVLVAEDDGDIVAFACAYGCDDERWGTQLDNLHVRRNRHRRGIGARLLAAVARWCGTTYPETGLYLWVLEQNHPARRFYERLGARDQEGDVWLPPDGSTVKTRRYVWSPAGVTTLQNGERSPAP